MADDAQRQLAGEKYSLMTQGGGTASDGSTWNPRTQTFDQPAGKVGGVTQLTDAQIQSMNAQTQGYKDSTAALQAQVDAQNSANKAGPQLQYNPLNDDGSLKDQYKLGSADSYTSALSAKNKLATTAARDAASQQAATGVAQSKENLAMRGGVGSNNSALLEAAGLKQGLANQQAASSQGAANEANLGVEGAKAQMDINKSNLGTQLTAGQNVNAFNLDKYNQNMAVKAANDQANATQSAANNSGGK